MPTYAYPSRTELLNTANTATLEEALFEDDIPQGYLQCALVQLVLRNETDQGLRVQPKNLKLPNVMVKTKTMGGRLAEVFLNFETGTTAQTVRGFQTLNTDVAEGPTISSQPFAYYTYFVAQSGEEAAENTGMMKRLDIQRSRQTQEVRGLCRYMEGHLQGTNTDITKGSQDQFSGIQHKISTTPTTSVVVQGLNQSTYVPWRNIVNASVGSFASGGLDAMRTFYLDLSGQNADEPPDLYMTTPTVAGYIIKAAEGIHRLVGSLDGSDLSMAKMPTHMGVPIFHTADAASGTIRAFSFRYLENVIQENANWKVIRPGDPNDQWVDGQSRRVFGASPLMMTRREKFGVLSGITA